MISSNLEARSCRRLVNIFYSAMTLPPCLLVWEDVPCAAQAHTTLSSLWEARKTWQNIKKPVEVSAGVLAMVWFPHPVGHLWGKKIGDTSFLRAMESAQLGCRGVLCVGWGWEGGSQWGWEPAVGLQESSKYLEILLWQGQTYCSSWGWWKGKAFFHVLMGTSWTLCHLGSHPGLLEKKVSLERKFWPAKV